MTKIERIIKRLSPIIPNRIKKYLYNRGVGRKQENSSTRMINDDTHSIHFYCPELITYLKKVHPRPWYDDEKEELFFRTYDFIRKQKILVSVKPDPDDRDAVMVKVGDCGLYGSNESKTYLLLETYNIYHT